MSVHQLAAEGLTFSYREGSRVLADVRFAAEPGRLACVLGPNGSGKTTLLRCLLGQLSPSEGRVTLETSLGHGAAFTLLLPEPAIDVAVEVLAQDGNFFLFKDEEGESEVF